ncbi:MAG TPA: GFA family protein [Solirubrobacteraceae bacterium]|nr:GFA family protein [Solirubrobacteraceae bacterium]
MSAEREGQCACGRVRYRMKSEPMFVHCCHCLNCQRQTGSAFAINLLIEAARVDMLREAPQPVDAPRDDGSVQRIFRCPVCEVALFSEYTTPELWFVRAGTLDDPADVTPDVHIFTRSKVGWVTIGRETPAFEVYYDTGRQWPAASLRRLEAIRAGAN